MPRALCLQRYRGERSRVIYRGRFVFFLSKLCPRWWVWLLGLSFNNIHFKLWKGKIFLVRLWRGPESRAQSRRTAPVQIRWTSLWCGYGCSKDPFLFPVRMAKWGHVQLCHHEDCSTVTWPGRVACSSLPFTDLSTQEREPWAHGFPEL